MPTALDRYFKISERGSSLPREIRGGLATFFAMAIHHRAQPDHPGQREGHVRAPPRQRPAGHRNGRDGRVHHHPDGRHRQRTDRAGRRTRRELRGRPPARAPHVVAGRDGHGRAGRSRRDAAGRHRAARARDERGAVRTAQGHLDRYRPVHHADRARGLRVHLPHPGRRPDHRPAPARRRRSPQRLAGPHLRPRRAAHPRADRPQGPRRDPDLHRHDDGPRGDRERSRDDPPGA